MISNKISVKVYIICLFKYRVRLYQKMRKRSGAIQAESQQQFIQLAEQSLKTIGIYYDCKDDVLCKMDFPKSLNQRDLTPKRNPFANFDFNQGKQIEKDQKQLENQLKAFKQKSIKNVIICDEMQAILQLLSNENPINGQRRTLDLITKRITGNDGSRIVIKYWVIDKKMIDSPLVQVYVNSAATVYWVTKLEQKFMQVNGEKCSVFDFINRIEQQENLFKSQ